MIQALTIVFKLAVLAVKLWPLVIGLVKIAEQMYDAPKSGASKFEAVMNGLTAAIETESDLTSSTEGLPPEKVQATLTKLIDKAVSKAINTPEAAAPAK